MIYIASDHGGYYLKNKIISFLQNKGYEIEDLGPHNFVPGDDYPDFGIPLAKKVAENEKNRGILICRNGVGMSLAANKINGVRCGISWNPHHAISSRKDDNTNVLALPADFIRDHEALHTVEAWINTSFSNDERHIRRLEKVKELEA